MSEYFSLGSPEWRLRYRQNYDPSGPGPQDKRDRRSDYAGTVGTSDVSEQQLIERMDMYVDQVAEECAFQQDFVYFGTDDAEVIIERLQSRPWAHGRIINRPHPARSKHTALLGRKSKTW